jgi:hypothetical protein
MGVYRFLIIVDMVLLAIAGHGGGNLTHGSKYLMSLTFDLNNPADFAAWDQMYQRVKTGEMPSKNEEQPAGEAKTDFLKQLKSALGD